MKVIKGRTTDFIIAPDGRWVHGLALIYVIREIPGVMEYQIRQMDIDSITVDVVTDGSFPPDGPERISNGIQSRLGENVRVAVNLVGDIARSASGKFHYIISEPARDKLASLEMSASK